MTDPAIRHAEQRVLHAADLYPDLIEGLEAFTEARRASFRTEQVLREDLASASLVRDDLAEKARRVADRRKGADAASKALLELAEDLGVAAWRATEVGDLPDLSVFAERRRLGEEVSAHELEIRELSHATGFTAVVKAKAMQAALLARSAAAKARFRGLEKAAGRALVEEQAEEVVRCDATEVINAKISSARGTVAALDALLNEANAELMKAGDEAAARFALPRVSVGKDLAPAEARIEAGIAAAQRDQVAHGRRILERLDVAVSLGQLDHGSAVWSELKALRELRDAGPRGAGGAGDDDYDAV